LLSFWLRIHFLFAWLQAGQ